MNAVLVEVVYINWVDLGWHATDQAGCVATFFSAGDGPVPSVIANRYNWENVDWDRIESIPQDSMDEWISSSPERCECKHFGDRGSVASAEPFGKRGLFVYDWSDKGEYELVCQPLHPILFNSLPGAVRQLVEECYLPVRFIEHSWLTISDLVRF